MNNHLCKYVLKCLAIVFLLTMALQSFAISFNESRKVVIPRYTNAVYRDLTVLDTMSLRKIIPTGYNPNLDPDITNGFLIEIGKRPGLFWNPDGKFYLYHQQQLTIDKTNYSSNDDGSRPFHEGNARIARMILENGTFLSQNMDFNNASLYKDSNLFMQYADNYSGRFEFGAYTSTWDIFTKKFGYRKNRLTNNDTQVTYHIDNLYLRDANFNGVKFPSPRLIIIAQDSSYKAKGTSTDFDLYEMITTSPKNYYGPWDLSGENISLSPNNACKSTNGTRCSKVVNGVAIDDDNDTNFKCAGHTQDSNSNTYDNYNECYDFNVIKISESSFNSPLNYNNNQSSFEFKVEEIFQMYGSSVTLISQTPKTRVSVNTANSNTRETIIPIMTYSSNTTGDWSWGVYSVPQEEQANVYVYIDGEKKPVANIETANNTIKTNPCFYLCDGKLCTENKVYISGWKERELKGGDSAPATSSWPQGEGFKQHLVIRTYTIGFCPKRLNTGEESNNNYKEYEVNFPQQSSGEQNLIEGRLIKNSSGYWQDGYICIRREVRCNSFEAVNSSHPGYNYKPLTTDY